MMRLTVTYNAFDVVTVPFPFTDSSKNKRRPALVLSSKTYFNEKVKHSIMAMITSAKNDAWPLDVIIGDLQKAGLSSPSVVRMKLFTLDHRLVVSKIGTLSEKDRKEIRASLTQALGDIF
ncbi:MAG: type II toxin-antitoxin system PemK/MazF family toxin [Deltaproteobacteria bacterium]|nr:MAG: type II toxin-antitoxin system PemK/MazF family toxin [Deltaproteobacteria bacterium]